MDVDMEQGTNPSASASSATPAVAVPQPSTRLLAQAPSSEPPVVRSPWTSPLVLAIATFTSATIVVGANELAQRRVGSSHRGAWTLLAAAGTALLAGGVVEGGTGAYWTGFSRARSMLLVAGWALLVYSVAASDAAAATVAPARVRAVLAVGATALTLWSALLLAMLTAFVLGAPRYKLQRSGGIRGVAASAGGEAAGPLRVDWAFNGLLGMCSCPGRGAGSNPQSDLETIAAAGTRLVVSLVDDSELLAVGAEREVDLANALGMDCVRHGWRDKWVPRALAPFATLARDVAARLARGERVVVHCFGGKGRTGLFCACVLLLARAESHLRRTAASRTSRIGLVESTPLLGELRALLSAVHALRLARPGMLRNPLQWLFALHWAHCYAPSLAVSE